MEDTPKKKITEVMTEEKRLKRAENRRALFQRLRGACKLLIVLAIFAYAFIHRAQIERVCHAGFDRVMKHVTLMSQARQKSEDYQKQLDDVTTNSVP
jgi:hypothetical protein